jgi:hypothetical protein
MKKSLNGRGRLLPITYFDMLIFIEAGKPDQFKKSVGQSVKNKSPINYKPPKSAKSQASKAAKNSDPEVQKQLGIIKGKKAFSSV